MRWDPLDDLLKLFSVRTRVLGRGPLADGNETFAAQGESYVHVIRRGRVDVRHKHLPALYIDEPTLLFYPRPLLHRFVIDHSNAVGFDCATIAFQPVPLHPIVQAMPAVLTVPLRRAPEMVSIIEWLSGEGSQAQYGKNIVVDRLFEVLITLLLRRLLVDGTMSSGLLAGLAHPRLGKALAAIHDAPEQSWSLENLAEIAGVSRSRFALEFKANIGVAVGEYLSGWRLALAQELLRRGTPLKQIASRVGYGSAFALTRAFEARMGESPRAWQLGSGRVPASPTETEARSKNVAPTLHDFLALNKTDLIDRCKEKVAGRSPGVPSRDLEFGISRFLDQLINMLQVGQTTGPKRSRDVPGPIGGQTALLEMSETATLHGRESLRRGYSLKDVVHDYGDLFQVVTDLAFEQSAPISTDEFGTLNRCLDNAIAFAVTEFGRQREAAAAEAQALALHERLRFFAHEVRNQLATVTLSLTVIKDGSVGFGGATGAVLEQGLLSLRSLVDRPLAEVRMSTGTPMVPKLISLSAFTAELKVSASLEAQFRHCSLKVTEVDSSLAILGDRDLLLAAAGNLLQNAFKFTQPGTEITLNAYATGDRILIDVGDRCGGLPPDLVGTMFQSFVKGGADKSGVGLGLAIARKSVEANAGTLTVRNIPGSGCVFTIDLARHTFLEDPEFAATSHATV